MFISMFAATQGEKDHLNHMCSAKDTIVCGSITIPPGTRGVIKDACTRLEGVRFSILWEKQTSAIWCSENKIIECIPKGPE